MTKKNRKHYVYVLKNPFDGAVFYVGKTCAPELRLKNHISGRDNMAKRAYIRSLGARPVMELIEECQTEAKAYLREAFYIRKFRKEGAIIFNKGITFGEEKKYPVNLYISEKALIVGKAKAAKLGISFSAFVELIIYDYNAE